MSRPCRRCWHDEADHGPGPKCTRCDCVALEVSVIGFNPEVGA